MKISRERAQRLTVLADPVWDGVGEALVPRRRQVSRLRLLAQVVGHEGILAAKESASERKRAFLILFRAKPGLAGYSRWLATRIPEAAERGGEPRREPDAGLPGPAQATWEESQRQGQSQDRSPTTRPVRAAADQPGGIESASGGQQ